MAGNQGGEFLDVDLVREMYDRQRKDAERIVTLADALRRAVEENQALKKAAAAVPAPTPTEGSRNEQDRQE